MGLMLMLGLTFSPTFGLMFWLILVGLTFGQRAQAAAEPRTPHEREGIREVGEVSGLTAEELAAAVAAYRSSRAAAAAARPGAGGAL